MKPIFIIAIAVVCSVVAVLGVLVILQGVNDLQFQQIQNELMNQEKIENQQIELRVPLDIEICAELLGWTVLASTVNDIYSFCKENGSSYIVEYKNKKCDEMPVTFASECRLKNTLDYYQLLIKKIEKLSEQERELMGFDSKTMNGIKEDMKSVEDQWYEINGKP
jgi:hypothetical protein